MPFDHDEFSLTKPKFDLSTYTGRLQHFLRMTNPLACLNTTADIRAAEEAIKLFREKGTVTGSVADMWGYQNVVNQAVHPATGSIVPVPFRMSGIPVFNIPIIYLQLICPSSNVVGTLGMHVINQSYNMACNYFNRSGVGVPFQAMGTAYALAVTSACSIAYGMGKLVQKVPTLKRFSIWIPIVATAMASSSNLALTRFDEIKCGSELVDKEGNVYGKSVTAGKRGVLQTAATRCLMIPCAVLLLPDMMMKAMQKRNLMPKNMGLATLVQCGIIFVCMAGALPATLAVFPQTIEYDVGELEPQFQHLTHKITGQPLLKLYSQKGL